VSAFKTIKDLVVAHIARTNGHVDYEELTHEVLQHFPTSKWQKSHWQYWRYQLAKGRSRHLLTEEQRHNLYGGEADAKPKVLSRINVPKASVSAPDPKVKRIGDHLLKQIRFVLDEFCGDDERLRFKVNRWVFSRLLIDERKAKKPIKEYLWKNGAKQCSDCGRVFESIKGVEIHRIDRNQVYSIDNCVLLCRPCHAKKVD
jgi:hypothetical protein